MLKRIMLIGLVLLLGGIASAGVPSVTAAQEPSPTPIGFIPANPCENSPETRLKAEMRAQIVAVEEAGQTSVALRVEPSHSADIDRYLPINTVGEILRGPECSIDGTQWWLVRVGQLTNWLPETSGDQYIMTPFDNTDIPAPLPSTVQLPLPCIKPAEPPALPKPSTPVLRTVFATPDGEIGFSDNAGSVRMVIKFAPAPLAIDLAPNGASAIVTTPNGLYWLDVLTGTTVMLADNKMLEVGSRGWTRSAYWMPDSRHVIVEVEDRRDNVYSYPIWNFPIDGSEAPFRIDLGAQPPDSIRRSPLRNSVVLLSANDFSPVPLKLKDDPKSLLVYTPLDDSGDARKIYVPALTWATDGQGFYTYIPSGEFTAPEDPVALHLWYVPLQGAAKDLGKLTNIAAGEYVIPSPDGKLVLIGGATGWRIQNAQSGQVLQRLPAVQYLFDWTPDAKGVVYTNPDGSAAFLGADGTTSSPYLPANVVGLYHIKWLGDGTTLYAVLGRDEKLSFSVRTPNKEAVFMGIISTTNAFSAVLLPGTPEVGIAPQSCK